MNDKKHIDRLFQEKFKDFEAEPPALVWKNIESALAKKKDRKVVPFWFRFAGVAALLLIGTILYSTFTNNGTTPETQIVHENKAGGDPSEGVTAPTRDAVVTSGTTDPAAERSSVPSLNQEGITESSGSASQAAPTVRNPSNTGPANFKRSDRTANSQVSTATANVQQEKKQPGSNEGIAGQPVNTDQDAKQGQPFTTEGSQVVRNEKNLIKDSDQDPANRINRDGQNLNNKDINKQTIAAANDGSAENKLDTTAIATVVPNPLEELLKENEKEEKIVETNLNRWQVTSSVAPIYFSSASKGSPIDGAFAQNDKSYDKNLSIGVGVNYAVNKKLSVRTGVNRFTLGYNTNGVVFFAGLNANNFDNITPAVNGTDIVVMSEGEAKAGLMPFEAGISNLNEGSINQRMGYIEVPLEMSYKLVDRKFGVSLIGGLSTLFLNENTVSVVSAGMSASLGRANNLNDVHFSSNVGLGFNYSFWKSFQFNFEPMFKYQINTFTKDDGNFKPYFIGLYSGLSFRF